MMNKFVYNGRDKKDEVGKNSPFGVAIVIAIMLMGVLGAAALPLVFFAAAGYIIYQQNKAKKEGVGSENSGGVERKEGDIRTVLSEAFADIKQNATKENTASLDESGRKHMDSKFEDVRRRQNRKKDGETFYSSLSRSEKTHFNSLEYYGHDEYAHRCDELKDLLNAGIIEMPEYKDRLSLLKEEFKR